MLEEVSLEKTLPRRIITATMAYRERYNHQMSEFISRGWVKPLGKDFVQDTINRLMAKKPRIDGNYPDIDYQELLPQLEAKEAGVRDKVVE